MELWHLKSHIGIRNKQSYFSPNKNKKTQLIYLGKKSQARAKQYSDNYKKLRAIIEEMTMMGEVVQPIVALNQSSKAILRIDFFAFTFILEINDQRRLFFMQVALIDAW